MPTYKIRDGLDITTRREGMMNGLHQATAQIIRSEDQTQLGPDFAGEGPTDNAAENAAIAEAKRWYAESRPWRDGNR